MPSPNSEYFLVTLDQLKEPTQAMGTSDLLYLLQYDARSSTYKADANKITLANLNSFLRSNNGTSITYNAGTNPGEVLLIPPNGIIPTNLLPFADGINKGIVGQPTLDTNITCTNGSIELIPVIKIDGISTLNDFNLNCKSFTVNGEAWKEGSISNMIIETTADTIVLDNKLNGLNPYYYLVPVGNIINFDTTKISTIGKKVYTINIILIANRTADLTWETNPRWITKVEAGKKYLIKIDVLPVEVLGLVTMVPSAINVI